MIDINVGEVNIRKAIVNSWKKDSKKVIKIKDLMPFYVNNVTFSYSESICIVFIGGISKTIGRFILVLVQTDEEVLLGYLLHGFPCSVIQRLTIDVMSSAFTSASTSNLTTDSIEQDSIESILELYELQEDFPVIDQFLRLLESKVDIDLNTIADNIPVFPKQPWSIKTPCFEYECKKVCDNKCLTKINDISKNNIEDILSPDQYIQRLVIDKMENDIIPNRYTSYTDPSRDEFSISGEE